MLLHGGVHALDLCRLPRCGRAQRGYLHRRQHRERGSRDADGGGAFEAGGLKNGFELARTDDRIDLGDVALNLVAVALHQAAGYHQPLRAPRVRDLVLHHLQNGVHRLLFR